MTTMNANTERRARYVKALDLIARSVNDEELLPLWLTYGVADEDITEDTTPEQIAEMGYCEDATFQGLLNTFAQLMQEATKDGPRGAIYAEGFIS